MASGLLLLSARPILTRLFSPEFLLDRSMSLRERTRPGPGVIEPCLPSPGERPPSGPGWLHEINMTAFASWPVAMVPVSG